MDSLNSLVLGLGLFFLGLRLVGQNLRELSGAGFRNVVKSATHTPLLAAALGVMSGMATQSATAVTFILVSMLGGGLIKPPSARLVVVWSNVGLTALAFLATVDIHPLVAYFVGGCGIALGAIRAKPWSTVAGALLGIGLLLFALENMGAGAAPLKDTPWFRQGLEVAQASPWLAFACGIGAAVLLQSNSGAAMLVITLSVAGAIPANDALPMIYGTNLGAIVLRGFLAMGLKGDAVRLVRTEDLFCLVSGALMMALFVAEGFGVPLVDALCAFVTPALSGQLAFAFLLSNLLPALLLSPLLPLCARGLDRFWRPGPVPPSGEPAFLSARALEDAPTALDLLDKEMGRLLGLLHVGPGLTGDRDVPADADIEVLLAPEFVQLASAIESFCVKLALRDGLGPEETSRLQLLRAALSIVRHIAEATGEFALHARALPAANAALVEPLRARLEALLAAAAVVTASLDASGIGDFYAQSRRHGQPITALRQAFAEGAAAVPVEQRLALGALDSEFEICVWLLHRLAKLLTRLNPGKGGGEVGPAPS